MTVLPSLRPNSRDSISLDARLVASLVSDDRRSELDVQVVLEFYASVLSTLFTIPPHLKAPLT
jgi:hypothetical protein